VPIELKGTTRKKVKAAALSVSQSGADVLVRINPPLRLAIRDLEHVVSQSKR